MCPAHSFDPTTVSALIQIFPKGTYEFSISEPKAYQRPNKEGKLTKGIRYGVTCEEVHDGDPNMKGERQFVNGYPSSADAPDGINEGGLAFIKGFLLAAYGYERTTAGQREFDAAMKGKDWALDFESGACGDAWRDVTGKRFLADMDTGINKDSGEAQQKWSQFRKVG